MDARVIAATNRDLPAMIAAGKFREDLYYRLATVKIKLPRLAERLSDIPLLQNHFIQKYSALYGKSIGGVTRRVSIILQRYRWPGNVRELENVIAHSCMLTTGDRIDVAHLPEELRDFCCPEDSPGGAPSQTIADMEYTQALNALAQASGNKKQAADLLGVSRNTLYRILRSGPRERAKTAGAP